jgi:hypothetical protein
VLYALGYVAQIAGQVTSSQARHFIKLGKLVSR